MSSTRPPEGGTCSALRPCQIQLGHDFRADLFALHRDQGLRCRSETTTDSHDDRSPIYQYTKRKISMSEVNHASPGQA